ncbi:MAG: outer membrane beta-barrel protein [Acidobacteriota bacterium]
MQFSKSCFLSAILCFFLSEFSAAQSLQITKSSGRVNGTISGVLIDSLSSRPVAYGNFILCRLRDSSLVNGAVSDSLGSFTLSNIPEGTYYAKVSVLGYKSRRKNKISINKENSVIGLDTIRLSQRSISTAVVLVTAEKEKVNYEDEKIVVNVNRTMGNNVSEVLENTPMVRVDIDGKISIQGRPAAPVVYIDGVPAKNLGFETAEDFRLISASDIEKIELVLEPGFEYSERPEGGVINIVTKKKAGSKYSANSGISASTRNNISFNLGSSHISRTYFIRGGYSRNSSRFNSSSDLSKTITLNDISGLLLQSSNSSNKSAGDFLNFTFGYNPDNLNNLYASTAFRGNNTGVEKSVLNQLNNNGAGLSGLSQSSSTTNTKQQFSSYAVGYTKLFKEKGGKISASFAYIHNTMDMDNSLNKSALSLSESPLSQNNTSGNKNNSFQGSVTFNSRLGKLIRINLGYYTKAQTLSMEDRYTEGEQRYSGLPRGNINTIYSDWKNSLYGTLGGDLWGINYLASLSADADNVKNKEVITGNSFKKSYLVLTPGLSISKRYQNGHSIGISYGRWNSYPLNKELNPHIDNSDSTEITMGNLNLKPYYRDQYGIFYRGNISDLSLSASIGYERSKDIIEKISIQENLHTAVATYKNLASANAYYAYMSAGGSLLSWLNIDQSLSCNNRNYKGFSNNQSRFSWSSSTRSEASFNFLKLMLDFNYNSSVTDAQSSSKPTFSSNAAVKLLLFEKQLSLTLKVQDMFNTLKQNKNIFGTGFYSVKSTRETTRIFTLSISYFFQSKANDMIEEVRDVEEYGDDF